MEYFIFWVNFHLNSRVHQSRLEVARSILKTGPTMLTIRLISHAASLSWAVNSLIRNTPFPIIHILWTFKFFHILFINPSITWRGGFAPTTKQITVVLQNFTSSLIISEVVLTGLEGCLPELLCPPGIGSSVTALRSATGAGVTSGAVVVTVTAGLASEPPLDPRKTSAHLVVQLELFRMLGNCGIVPPLLHPFSLQLSANGTVTFSGEREGEGERERLWFIFFNGGRPRPLPAMARGWSVAS